MTNELTTNVNEQTGEIMEKIVNETDEFRIVQLPNGKYRKDMKYKDFHSRIAQTEEEEIELYKVFNDSDSELVTTLSGMIDKEINIAHFFTQGYESFDEDTGSLDSGVVTTIEDVDGSYYVTSSKSVYYTLFNIMDAFGYPNEDDYKPVKVSVTGTKQARGVQIDLKLIGRS